MKTERYKHLRTKIRESIENPKNSTALMHCMQRGRDKRSDALAVLPGGAAFREDVKKTKDRCIEQQPELLERFVTNAKKRGAQVFIAKDGAAAIEYVLRLAEKRGATIVAKSKSLTTEEIEINHPLLEAGFKVIETDLGELIIQLVGEKPYHLVFPSVHKMAEDVAEIFSKATGKPVPNDIPAIMKVVQAYLRPIFLEAEIGMTGANIGVAENGAIVIETNEGNARLVSSIGDCHVCVMGMEKIVDTVEDAMLMVLAHPVSASGQLPTTYVTWMAGRSPLGDGASQHPRESHIIILDNGRTAMREDEAMREALSCIRCGACMNVCPTYGVVGGHTFGYIYPGPIGIPWTSEVHGLEKAGDFASLCISCGLCKEICPAQIDMPMMIAEVKHRDAKKNGHPIVDEVMMGADSAARLASTFAPIANAVMKNNTARKVIASVAGISAERKLPEFKRDTFVKQFARHKSAVRSATRKVAFFVDVYANYNAPELGMAAVSALEAAGCEVVVPQQMSSGYPYIAYGDLDRARETAAYNVARFAPYAEQDFDVVATEPTAAYALKVSYPKLLKKSGKACAVAMRTYELFEYLLKIESEDAASSEKTLSGRRFGFHVSCHQRPLGSGNGAMEWLRRRGATVEMIETGTCCGMGGTFGLKGGALGYELSMAVGKPLFEKFRESGVDTIISESSVCAIQLAEGVGVQVMHPLAVLNL